MKQLKKTAILLMVLLLCFGALPASAQKKFDNKHCLNLIRYYMGEMEGAMYEKGERLLENGNCQKYTFGSWTRNACYGEVTFQQHQELNEKVYWSLDIINPANDDPPQLELTIYSDHECQELSNLRELRIFAAEKELRPTFIMKGFGRDLFAFNDDEWIFKLDDELRTLFADVSAFPLRIAFGEEYQATLDLTGAESAQGLLTVYSILLGETVEPSDLLTDEEKKKIYEEKKEIYRNEIIALAKEQDPYDAIFPKAAFDYYLAALKNRDADALLKCTQYAPVLLEAFAGSKTKYEQLYENEKDVPAFEEALGTYRNYSIITRAFMGKVVKQARSDKPESFFNLGCVSPFPKGIKKYAIAIKDVSADQLLGSELFMTLGYTRVAEMIVLDKKSADITLKAVEYQGKWYVVDDCVSNGITLMMLDNSSVQAMQKAISETDAADKQ